jgi:hypothetical protein
MVPAPADFRDVTRFTESNLWPGYLDKSKILQATTMSAEEEYYRKGDRVRLSELGQKRMTRNRATTATVVGYGRSETTIRIVFDGSSYPVSIHTSYLERNK